MHFDHSHFSGRRIAEMEIQIALAHILKAFKLEFPEKEPLGYVQKFLTKPDRQMDIVFKDCE